MREIKFRAWDVENQLWLPLSPDVLAQAMEGEADGTFELPSDPDVVIWCQYTGLKDKNGKEVWEGDLVRFNTKGGNEMIYDVRWSDYHAGFKPTRLTQTNHQEMTVIGNIYQNPELLRN